MRGSRAKALRRECDVPHTTNQERRYATQTNRLGLTELSGELVTVKMPGTIFNAPDTPRAIYQRAKKEYS